MNFLYLGDEWNGRDLSTVPTKHLASLVSIVKDSVYIEKVTGCDLVTIFDSLNCRELSITNQRLGREKTKAVWRAMKTSRVRLVRLYDVDKLDVEALPKFPELGRHIHLSCWSSTEVTYARKLRRWAHREGWAYEIITKKGDFRKDDFEDEDNEQDEDKIGKVYKIGLQDHLGLGDLCSNLPQKRLLHTICGQNGTGIWYQGERTRQTH